MGLGLCVDGQESAILGEGYVGSHRLGVVLQSIALGGVGHTNSHQFDIDDAILRTGFLFNIVETHIPLGIVGEIARLIGCLLYQEIDA